MGKSSFVTQNSDAAEFISFSLYILCALLPIFIIQSTHTKSQYGLRYYIFLRKNEQIGNASNITQYSVYLIYTEHS